MKITFKKKILYYFYLNLQSERKQLSLKNRNFNFKFLKKNLYLLKHIVFGMSIEIQIKIFRFNKLGFKKVIFYKYMFKN